MPSPKKKPALGRGLGSLMGEAQSETGYTATETQMSIGEIFPNPNQPRTHFNESELEELSESIRENGVLQPLLVRKMEASTRLSPASDGIRRPRLLDLIKSR